jgi:hypothetical protein
MEMKQILKKLAVFAGIAVAGAAAADTRTELTTGGTTDEPVDRDGPGGLDSGGEDWGRYELSASSPVSGLARIGAHHARRWRSDPDHPEVQFVISEHANDWDIEEMGLEIKADHVPGYYIRARVCARSSGNIGGVGGAIDTLTFSGADTYPETQLGTFDPTGLGTCAWVTAYNPVEAGADEYTIMVRPQLQIVQAYWEYTVYGKVIVQYYPILD